MRSTAVPAPAPLHHTLRDQVGQGLGAACQVYGMNPLYGRLWGALLLSPRPVPLAEVADMVGTAKSTTSVALRKLEGFGAVRRFRLPKDRRDHYEVVADPVTLLAFWLKRFLLPEMAEARAVASGMAAAMGGLADELPPDEHAVLTARTDAFVTVIERSADMLSALLTEAGTPDKRRLHALLFGEEEP